MDAVTQSLTKALSYRLRCVCENSTIILCGLFSKAKAVKVEIKHIFHVTVGHQVCYDSYSALSISVQSVPDIQNVVVQ